MLDLALAQERLALDDEETDLARAFLAWVDTRFEVGAATTSERLAAVLAVNESSSRRGARRGGAHRGAATLATTIGVLPEEIANLRPILPPLATCPRSAPRTSALRATSRS